MVPLETDEDFAMLESVLDLPEMLDTKEGIESEGEETEGWQKYSTWTDLPTTCVFYAAP